MKQARVIIVENDEINRDYLQRELLRLDYEICGTFATGEEAVEKVAQMEPDFILMDVGLDGDLDGIETAEAIAQIRPTPVVYLSATTDETTLTRARKTRPYGYLVKPCSQQTLNAALQMVMERLQTDRALQASETRLREAALVFDATQDGILILDHSHRITSVNQRFTEITGFEHSEIINQYPYFLNPAELSTSLFDQIDGNPISDRAVFQLELAKSNGEKFPANIVIANVRNRNFATCDPGVTSSHHVLLIGDLTAVRMAEDKLYRMAHHDPLTGLPNRQLAMDRLRQAIEQAKRRRSHMAVMFVDLDNFKRVNDSLGHSAGDELLRAVAESLQSCVRSVDTVARLGGDEFLVVLDNVDDTETVANIAEKILRALDRPIASVIPGKSIRGSASIGIGFFPDAGTTPDQLIRAADTAMYHAKSSGRCRYSIYNGRMLHSTAQRAQQERRLRYALENDQLELHYQPLVAMANNEIIGVEALLRWRHPYKGMLSADKVIALAEDGDCMQLLNEWVLRKACDQMVEWRRMNLQTLRMSVNLTAAQLLDENFVNTLKHALIETAIDPDQLEIEIKEADLCTALLPDGALDAIQQLGIGLAIDDFGSGLCSVSKLKKFPVRRVKIDRKFIRQVPHNEEDSAVVKAILAMVKELDVAAAAGGVETQEQEAFLRASGCQEAQGFLYAAALTPAYLGEMLKPARTDALVAELGH